jgi:sugar lactone lactonase YvrE
MVPAIRAVLPPHGELGEGPHWDEVGQELLHVDIPRGLVHGWQPASGSQRTRRFQPETSSAIPRARGGLIVAVGHALVLEDLDGERREVARVEPELPDNRFNDCRCDPQGRLWAGTMSRSGVTGAAALYRLAPGRPIERVIAGTTTSNGLGWSPAGDRMYFVDTPTQRVDVLSFDGTTGEVSERRPFATIDPADGKPDGLTVDAAGGVWVALWSGGAVRRYASDGTLDAVVRLPVTNVTCPVFGGADLRTLYVTTARQGRSPEQLAAEPLAGAVLAFEPGVLGRPGNRFAG